MTIHNSGEQGAKRGIVRELRAEGQSSDGRKMPPDHADIGGPDDEASSGTPEHRVPIWHQASE
jgi:hypothetical protein